MKKLILAAFVMCLAGGVYAANQQCFYGRNCVDGKLVKEHRRHGLHMHKHWGFMRNAHKIHKSCPTKEGCPCKEEGKCAAAKAGKNCGCKTKIKKNKDGRAAFFNRKEQGKLCACAQDRDCGCKDKKHPHNAPHPTGKDKK